jgi:hypothetical protein
MLIIAAGKTEDRGPFSCTLPFDGAIGNPKEAIKLLEVKRLLFADWIESITLLQDQKVLRHWVLKDGEPQ